MDTYYVSHILILSPAFLDHFVIDVILIQHFIREFTPKMWMKQLLLWSWSIAISPASPGVKLLKCLPSNKYIQYTYIYIYIYSWYIHIFSLPSIHIYIYIEIYPLYISFSICIYIYTYTYYIYIYTHHDMFLLRYRSSSKQSCAQRGSSAAARCGRAKDLRQFHPAFQDAGLGPGSLGRSPNGGFSSHVCEHRADIFDKSTSREISPTFEDLTDTNHDWMAISGIWIGMSW